MKRAAVAGLLLAVLLPAVQLGPGEGSAVAQEGCAAAATTVLHERPWAQDRLAPDGAWQLTRGAGITVAVVGTGVSAAPPQLAGAVLPGIDVRPGSTDGRGDGDCAGHGTFAASLIAARPAAGVGLVGVAPEATVLPVRVTTDPAQTDPAALADGIAAAVDSGARVVAVTLATDTALPAMRSAIEAARQRDVLVVAPAALPASLAARVAENVRPQAFPAALPGVLPVAAVGRDGTVEARALGAQPALAAPGKDLTGLAPTGPGQVTASAAELAVAFVAGAAALVRARYPDLTVDEVTHRLTDTADHPPGPLPNPTVGFGMVDPTPAVTTMARGADTRVAAPDTAPVVLAPVPVPDRRSVGIALVVSGLVIGVALLVGLVAVAVAAARRRRGVVG